MNIFLAATMKVVLFVVLFGTSLSFAFDFNQNCSQKKFSVYVDGVCYKAYNQSLNVSFLETFCKQQGFQQLATIRSADVVQGLQNITNLYYTVPADTTPKYIVQAPNGKASNYLGMNITNSTDNTLSVILNLNNTGKLPSLFWSGMNPSVTTLTDEVTLDVTWPFCEICKHVLANRTIENFIVNSVLVPVYTQKGCGQALSSNTSFIVQSLEQCVDKCSTYIWCAGVNFNWQQNLCQVLADNLSSKNMVANSSWSFYERSSI